MSKPSIKEFMDATGVDFLTASNVIYGDIGANLDTRDWGAIMSSPDEYQAARTALADMYSDPVYRARNTDNLVAQGYQPAQAYFTYNQMNDRVGATYVPTLDEVNAVNNYFQGLGLPDAKWSFNNNNVNTNTGGTGGSSTTNTGVNTNTGSTTRTTTGNTGLNTGTGASAVNQITSGARTVQPQVMGPLLSGGGGSNWNARQAVGGASGALMGAGNANYNSSLIRSLRQNSLTPFSTNAGVMMAPNQGNTNSNWAQPSTPSAGAFNPQVLNPRTATPQEINDWNAYSSYRTNSLTAKTPIVSFAEWLAGGKVNGQAPTNTTPPPDYQYDGGG